MNILIIGSKGFIGSHCVNYFSKLHKVSQCDIVVDHSTPNYYQLDEFNTDYTEIFKKGKYDVCINCSGAASVPDSIKNPQKDFILNTVNVFKQLDAIRMFNNNCKYINLSSAAVYGNPKYLPIDEVHPLEPISPYGIHKKMAEEICKSFYDNYQIKSCSLRIFSALGVGLQKQLFWDLYKKAQSDNKISLFGTGNESRDFIYVLDVVQAINAVIENGNFNHEIINVANGKELTIKKVARTFYDIYKPDVDVLFQNQKRVGDPSNWVADIAKLNSYGFKSQFSLNDGLILYVKWLKEIE